jgi:uncharacterized membrane protein YhaH (DUF805 family)
MELLFSSTGRIGRGLFLALAALLLGLTLAYQGYVEPFVPGWTRWIVYPALLFSGACVLCKRLHDRGRAGWWAAVVLLALAIGLPEPYDPRQIAAAAVLLIAFVDLGLWPGQAGFNRFGPRSVKSG